MSLSLTKVFSSQSGWYCSDFHAHTTCSDGVLSPHGLNDLSIAHGLDFLVITDHNAIRAFDDFDESDPRLIIPGVEVTFWLGHFNVFGIEGNTERMREIFRTVVDRPIGQAFEEGKDHGRLVELLDRIAGAGLFISMDHPLLWPWEWRDNEIPVAYFNGIELINDPSYKDNPTANPATRRMWSAWLNAGYRLTGLGGSDFHSLEPGDDPTRVSRLNLPLTYVYARELSCQAILEGIRARRVYISMGPKIVFQGQMDGQVYLMGDDLGEIHSAVDLYARVEGCSGPARALLIRNGELIAETPVEDGNAEIEWQVSPGDPENCWYRFDVIDPADQGLVISNPLFFGPHPVPGAHTFGSFLSAFARA